MKQIIALVVLLFLFFGCTPKQTVQLKMPNQQNSYVKPTQQATQREDKKTVVQEFEPIDIVESSGKAQPKKQEIKKEEPVEYDVAPIMEGDKIENQTPSKSKGSSENEVIKSMEKQVETTIPEIDTSKVKMKVAFLYPSNLVSKYAKSSIGTVSGYLSFQNSDYELIVIDTENENSAKIATAFQQVREQNIKNVIGLFTPNSVGTLSSVVTSDLKVYLPLIEKKDAYYDMLKIKNYMESLN